MNTQVKELDEWRDWAIDVLLIAHTVVKDSEMRDIIGAQARECQSLEAAAKGRGKGDQRDEYICRLSQQLRVANERVANLEASNTALTRTNERLALKLVTEQESVLALEGKVDTMTSMLDGAVPLDVHGEALAEIEKLNGALAAHRNAGDALMTAVLDSIGDSVAP